jgi:hypothetical protein
MYGRIFVLLISAIAAFAQQLIIDTPSNVGACTRPILTWSGGSPPYFLAVYPGGQPNAAPLQNLGVQAGTFFSWLVNFPIGTPLFMRIRDFNGVVSDTGPFTIQPSAQCPNNCIVGGSIQIPQEVTPSPTQCNPGDTSLVVNQSSTCSALTTDGSTIYTSSSNPPVCCNSIPAGTVVCKVPPPCNSGYLIVDANAESACTPGDQTRTFVEPVSCENLAGSVGTSVDQLYTLASSNNICCDSLPVGTTVCQKVPPPTCAAFVPTRPATTSTCLTDDRSVSLSVDITCDVVVSLLNIESDDFYTISGPDICCSSIPAGTILCVPTPITPSCPTTTTPPPSTTPARCEPANVSGYKDWNYLDCFSDSVANRVLPVPMGIHHMTVEKCLDACSGAGFAYAGLEYAKECYCGQSAPPTIATDGRCNMSCKGDSNELCGGPDGLSVYHAGPTASILHSYLSWTYSGCYEDSIAARTLPHEITSISANSMTVEKCLDACRSAGFSYAGLEWSQECFCGEALPPTQATDGRCSMVCKGNALEYCGGGNGLTVYTYSYTPVIKVSITARSAFQ